MNSYVVLSPHFDDGVLSCGGRIFLHRQGGDAVRVLTLFADGPEGDVPPFAQEQHRMWGNPPDANRLRRAEDLAAYGRLGCFDVYHLDAPDAVYRKSENGQPRYNNVEAIFGEIHPDEHDYDLNLVEMVRAYLPAHARVLAPWAIGNHVDHQLTHRVALLLEEEGWEVGYYLDVPYMEKIDPYRWEPTVKDEWRVNAEMLDEDVLAAKVAAMSYYRTQIPVLYGNEAEMARRLRRVAELSALETDPMSELLWWRLPPHHSTAAWNGSEGGYNDN